jgi:hypothetical protein
LEVYGWKSSWPNLRYYSDIWVARLKKISGPSKLGQAVKLINCIREVACSILDLSNSSFMDLSNVRRFTASATESVVD